MDTSGTYDYIIIGSGFGGSVSALRLAEKGYRVLVVERGKRYKDEDFAESNLLAWKYLWAPLVRCFGILQISPYKDVLVLHGSGVGGGSLGYANVLLQPEDHVFDQPGWRRHADWKNLLKPHYETARYMLGVTPNPRKWVADHVLYGIAQELGQEDTFHLTDVGVFFGEPGQEGQEVPDPYFGGKGPNRQGCILCGGCMVGCRHNAKNTLDKNYLYLAEKRGAHVLSESLVTDIQPLSPGQSDGARYKVTYHESTTWFTKPKHNLRARNVIVSGGTLGTLQLLFRCRDVSGSLPEISKRLGDFVRTNSESLLGSTDRSSEIDWSQGIAITSIFHADGITTIEPVRYPIGSDLMRMLASPLMSGGSVLTRLLKSAWNIITKPVDFAKTHILPGWARRSTILLVMQNEDNQIRMRLGRSVFTFFRRGLVSEPDHDHPIRAQIDIGHQVTRAFAKRTNGIALGSFNESLFNIPVTAHILGGCPIGADDQEGVIGLDFQVHNYPGLYVVDGSVLPGNPGVNPSLTITAMAEYAMHQVQPKPDASLQTALTSTSEAIPVTS